MGIYSDNAMKYFEKGITTIPVNGKRPVHNGWNEFVTRQATEDEIEQWAEQSPNAGIGLPCGPGNNILILDFDETDEEILKEMLEIAPLSPVVRFGAKGEARIYRFYGEEPIKQVINRVHKNKEEHACLEVFYNGQVVLPPSIHPDTKKPYVWSYGESLLDIDLEDIPIIDWKNIDKIKDFIAKNSNGRTTGVATGRNNNLTKHVSRMIKQRIDPTTIIRAIMTQDKIDNTDNALFDDDTEKKNIIGSYNKAMHFFMGHFKAATNNFKIDLIPPELSKTNMEYPTKHNGFFSKDKNGKLKPDPHGLAAYFVNELKYVNENGSIYKFNGEFYELRNTDQIKEEIDKVTFRQCTKNSERANFLEPIKSLSTNHSFCSTPSGLLNVKNGILNTRTKKLIPHSSDVFFKNVIDIEYKHGAQCPNWLKMLGRIFPGDADSIKLLQQYFAYVLWGGDPIFHKALVLIGGGANGKSTVLKTLQALLGAGSYSSISMSRLDKPFQMIMIKDKLANIVDETPSSDAIDSEAFKNVVGGGNVSMSHKFMDEISEPVRARLIFSCNETPRFKDSSHGLRRRLLFLPFEQDFSGSNTKYNIWRDEIEPELSGVLNWCLELLPIDETWRFVEPQSSVDAMHEYKMDQDHVYVFVNDRLEYTGKTFDTLTPDEIYRAYEVWAFNEGYNKLGKRWLMRKVIMNLTQKYKINKNYLCQRSNTKRSLYGIKLI